MAKIIELDKYRDCWIDCGDFKVNFKCPESKEVFADQIRQAQLLEQMKELDKTPGNEAKIRKLYLECKALSEKASKMYTTKE